MFDWPEASQTSPTSTSRAIARARPSATSSYGPPAGSASRVARNRPDASAVAFAVLPASVTVTASPGSLVPHTGSGRSRWSTAWSVKTDASRSSAGAGPAPERPATVSRTSATNEDRMRMRAS